MRRPGHTSRNVNTAEYPRATADDSGRSSDGAQSAIERLFEDALEALDVIAVPFMIGGAYAMRQYAGIVRETEDLDVFRKTGDYPLLLQALAVAGWRTEVTDERWLAKAFRADALIDIF
jgi:hypothetical protein